MQITVFSLGTYATARVDEDLDLLAALNWAEEEGLCDEPQAPCGLPHNLQLQAEQQAWDFRYKSGKGHRIKPIYVWVEDPSSSCWASRVLRYAEPSELYDHVVRMARTRGRSSAAQYALRLVYAEWKDTTSDHWAEIEAAIDCRGLTLAQYLGFEPD